MQIVPIVAGRLLPQLARCQQWSLTTYTIVGPSTLLQECYCRVSPPSPAPYRRRVDLPACHSTFHHHKFLLHCADSVLLKVHSVLFILSFFVIVVSFIIPFQFIRCSSFLQFPFPHYYIVDCWRGLPSFFVDLLNFIFFCWVFFFFFFLDSRRFDRAGARRAHGGRRWCR